jgi:hypothetical protein
MLGIEKKKDGLDLLNAERMNKHLGGIPAKLLLHPHFDNAFGDMDL